jgi:ribonuclease BN (tRNA processing enzyme)
MKAEFDFAVATADLRHIGEAEIELVRLNHPGGGYGLKLIDGDRVLVFLTDNELGYAHKGGLSEQDYIDFSAGCDLLIHDAQYTEQEYQIKAGWGHSTFTSATQLAILAGVKKLGLCHHDLYHNDDDIDNFVDICRTQNSQADSAVDCFGLCEGMEISV